MNTNLLTILKTVMGKVVKWLLGWLPRRLELQIMLLTVVCLVTAILLYGFHIASIQTADAKRTITAQMRALALNLATIDAHFWLSGETARIETLTLQTATVNGIYSVLVTDTLGQPMMEVVNQNGIWSPRYGLTKAMVPDSRAPDATFDITPFNPEQVDYLAGRSGTMSAWHRIIGPPALGWVRVNYRLDTFEQIAANIRLQALQDISLATVITLLLFSLLLRPRMRSLRAATEFASTLGQHRGNLLTVSRSTSEIEALGLALNVVAERLELQRIDIQNQQFAIDQHAIVSITDLQGNIIYANQRFCDISGFSRDELLGQNHRVVKSDEHPAAVFEELWRTITHGQVWRGEIKNRKKDGEYYWVNATIVPLMGYDGLPHQYIGIRTDITANKDLEKSLQTAKDQAEAATLAKGQFLANMSHEIRTPMNAILGMLHLMHHTDLSKRQLDYVNKAGGAAQSLLGLINDILDFSKIEAGKMVLEVRDFRLDKLLRDLSVIVSSNVGNKPLEVLFDIDPQTPKCLVGDILRLQQVLINLCGNAVKFTANGEVVISVKVLALVDQAVTLRFGVRDTGIGISPENQARIFDGFSQAEASTTRRFGGTGLGLSISRRLVALMGGELSLQSAPGQGSTFSFIIRLPTGADPAEDSPPMLPPEQALAAHLSVLVVDDNPTARQLLVIMAQSLGWHVDVATDGPQALALVQARAGNPYQAIFVDWQMPGMDGWETIIRLQALPSQSPVVVMVTAHGREMLNQRSADDQARLHGFLVKPVTASMMFDAVADALACRALPPGSPPAPQSHAQPLRGMHLLVVEDNLVNQQVAQEMLESEGARVDLACNGQLGIEAVLRANLAGAPFDAVLMDIQMPVMDGYAATRVLRQDMGLTALPIIAMTANAMASDRDTCLAVGMNAHIGKPFNLAQLVALLQDTPPLAATDPSLGTTPSAKTLSGDLSSGLPLPPVDSVDTVSALDRLGGNQALYRRVLLSYMDDIAVMPNQLDVCLGQADLKAATRMLHALKGLSATVGANYLAAVVRRAEIAVKIALDSPDPDSLSNAKAQGSKLRAAINVTQTVMNIVAQSLEPAPNPPPPRLPVPSAANALTSCLTQLRELHDLLEASDMHALSVYEDLWPALAQADPGLRQQLESAMSTFNFAYAAGACASLIQQAVQNTSTVPPVA